MSAGKGDKPRNCFSEQFKQNYEDICWNKPPDNKSLKKEDIHQKPQKIVKKNENPK